ncbi:MAG: sodium:proton antiporter [Verrucomicrobia bacterium]|nr:sodium:proton antiporter [Verrucomicrobiota bacterium]
MIEPHLFMLLPFVVMLLCIALLPLILQHHWERYYHWVAILLAAIPVGYYALVLKQPRRLLHEAGDYFSFIALIGSLFVVTGGIHIAVRGHARALKNSLFLLLGGVLANVLGTTGASILLIRPWLRLNRGRYRALHTAFFIFIIGNVGGALTPLGPPLLLGYLKGVPFWWPAIHCLKPWLVAMVSLLAIFYLLDTITSRGERQIACESEDDDAELTGIQGRRNLWFLGIILLAVFVEHPPFLREILMLTAAGASYYFTPRSLHQLNSFSFRPIQEVAWLFLGIFATMVPVMDYMQAHAAQIPIGNAAQYFWITGGLSSVLDNAPTYLTFVATALGRHGFSIENPAQVGQFIAREPLTLSAISMGAVIFGALTYIGNGPNFLVKSIVQQSRHAAPGFFGYLAYSVPVFAPVLGLVWLLVFR